MLVWCLLLWPSYRHMTDNLHEEVIPSQTSGLDAFLDLGAGVVPILEEFLAEGIEVVESTRASVHLGTVLLQAGGGEQI